MLVWKSRFLIQKWCHIFQVSKLKPENCHFWFTLTGLLTLAQIGQSCLKTKSFFLLKDDAAPALKLAKGHLISKVIYGLPTSFKKRTDEFDLFAFLLFTENKSNLSVRFFGESMARQSAFQYYLTFSDFISFFCTPNKYVRLKTPYI